MLFSVHRNDGLNSVVLHLIKFVVSCKTWKSIQNSEDVLHGLSFHFRLHLKYKHLPCVFL